MNIIEKIKAKLIAAYKHGDHDERHAVIKFDFRDGEMLTEEEETELLEFIKEKINPERVYICCNRRHKEENLPWSACLHLHGVTIEGSFTQLLMQGFNVRK